MITIIKNPPMNTNYMTQRLEETDGEAMWIVSESDGDVIVMIDIGLSSSGHAIVIIHDTLQIFDFNSSATWEDLLDRIFIGLQGLTIMGKVLVQDFNLTVKERRFIS